MANKTSSHILNSAGNLPGFCLFVITSLHIANMVEAHYIDELTSVIAVLATFSCIFSFMSIKTNNPIKERRFEAVADYIFILTLIGILVIILLITLNFIN